MKRIRFLIYLIVLIGWIVFIFCRSFQPADISTAESRWVLDLLRRIVSFELSMRLIRKLAHFIEFAIMGLIAGLLFGNRCKRLFTGLLYVTMIGVVTALCDETIQLFADGRTSQVSDIMLDVAGTSIGAAVALIGRPVVNRVRSKHKQDR